MDALTLKGSRILVTGGLGFVGHNLVKSLVQRGAIVTVVDNCANSSIKAIEPIRKLVDFREMSVIDEHFADMVSEFDLIFHLACIQIAHSSKDPVNDLRVNAESTLKLLEAIRSGNQHLKRFIYTSSASVYGNSANSACVENSATRVLSHYSATKLLGEHYTMIYSDLYKLPTTVVRYSNIYGYGQSPENGYCGVIGKFVHNALTGAPLIILGDGEQTRDYTFIDDAVNATVNAAVSSKSLGELYNVGTGKETSVNQIVGVLKNLIGPVEIQYEKERFIDNIRRRVLNIDKIYSHLGWTPETNLELGLHKTIDWYRSQPLNLL